MDVPKLTPVTVVGLAFTLLILTFPLFTDHTPPCTGCESEYGNRNTDYEFKELVTKKFFMEDLIDIESAKYFDRVVDNFKNLNNSNTAPEVLPKMFNSNNKEEEK